MSGINQENTELDDHLEELDTTELDDHLEELDTFFKDAKEKRTKK